MQQQSVSVKERQQATGSDRINTLYSLLFTDLFADRFHWSYYNSLSCFYAWFLSTASVDSSLGVPCGGSRRVL
jgi:hypothetical protein